MKKLSTEAALYVLSHLDERSEADMQAMLTHSLGHRSAAVVAVAARQIAQRQVHDLIDACNATFQRLLPLGVKGDSGCLAKTALVEALNALDALEATPFLAGVGLVQMEPVYGGQADTAANLRGHCGLGLARLQHPYAHLHLVDLLMDPELPARLNAIRALTYLGDDRSECVLRMKVLAGDEVTVVADALSALAQIAPDRSLPFIAARLDAGDPAVAEGAALALGEMRTPEALDRLFEEYERRVLHAERRMLLLPIALNRSPAAFAFLLSLIEEGAADLAKEALEALESMPLDDAARGRIAAARRSRKH
jgi:HEAT repeat protein